MEEHMFWNEFKKLKFVMETAILLVPVAINNSYHLAFCRQGTGSITSTYY